MLTGVLRALRSLVVYRELSQLPPWRLLKELLEGLLEGSWSPPQLIEGYYDFLNAFLSCDHDADFVSYSWKEWILDMALYHENQFTLWAEGGGEVIPQAMELAVANDLNSINEVANIPWKDLMERLEEGIGHGYGTLLNIFVDQDKKNWGDLCTSKDLRGWDIHSLREYHRHKGSGPFSRYRGFYWNGEFLEGIKETDPITLDQLIGYDNQKQTLLDNTEKFLRGGPANNVLLYGDKGTGKSSMVKALIHRYWDDNLRIIELPKIHMGDYHAILNLVEGRGYKFILFIDDLSFEEEEVEYKHIKALLEGGLKVKPSNLLVYATSNRRHLVREMFSDRSSQGYQYNDRNEISPTDSMQEKLSLSDRFGITLTFISPNQRGYLEMIEAMAKERGIDMEREILYEKALRWEKRYNGRSGRTARQFIDDLTFLS